MLNFLKTLLMFLPKEGEDFSEFKRRLLDDLVSEAWKTGRIYTRKDSLITHGRISGVNSMPKNLSTQLTHYGGGPRRSLCNVAIVLSEEDYPKQMLQFDFALTLAPEESATASIEVRPLRESKSWFPRNKITESYDLTYQAKDDQAAYQPLAQLPLSDPGTYIDRFQRCTSNVPLSEEFFEGEDLSYYLKINYAYHYHITNPVKNVN